MNKRMVRRKEGRDLARARCLCGSNYRGRVESSVRPSSQRTFVPVEDGVKSFEAF